MDDTETRSLFKKYEKMLKIKKAHTKKRSILTKKNDTNSLFKVPRDPNSRRAFRWIIQSPGKKGIVPPPYTVKFSPRAGKLPKYPKTITAPKREFTPRRDSYLAVCEAMFPSRNDSAEPLYVHNFYSMYTNEELSEEDLRSIEDLDDFFYAYDRDLYKKEDCEDIIKHAMISRMEEYQEMYKVTSNYQYLAEAVFFKFLDLTRLSPLHKLYILLSEETDFQMGYVEKILRQNYTVLD